MPSTTGMGASDAGGYERKRGRSLHRISSSSLPDWTLAKRFKVSGKWMLCNCCSSSDMVSGPAGCLAAVNEYTEQRNV